MGLIEQAAKRLEELRRAGFEAGRPEPPPEAPFQDITPRPVHTEPPARAAQAQVAVPSHPEATPPLQAAPARPQGTSPGRVVKLDSARLAAEGLMTPEAPRSRLADEFRILKRPLIANATPKAGVSIKNANLIMVTSAAPGDGKTFTSVNLAMSIAMELDRTVLLVDGDVVRPSLPRMLGLAPDRGLLEILGPESASMSDVMLRTNVPKLSILLSGKPNPRGAEMLASNMMNEFLDELATRYSDRIVIFDSPPVLLTTEARQLATRMGQIVFVVHAEKTRQSDVRQAVATLEACPVKLLVLNGATTTGQGAYGYGYGYGYGGDQ
jgi:exopolysaccharide/PEP-CTERM locus tyrosine autokinase